MYDTGAKPSDEEQLLGEDLPFIPKTFSSGPNRLQLIDEYMRFLDKGDGEEKTSDSILDVGVQKAIKQVRWDQDGFRERGGVYNWSKEAEKMQICATGTSTGLQW
jgi:radical S-adenosyl methionine domain-containing protein 2